LDVRSFATNDPVGFLRQHPEGMSLDEVQNVPALLSYIQGIVDEYPEKKYILTGSSNFSLLKSVTQSLSGRTAIFELLPLSLSEIAARNTELSLDELICSGLYPAVITGKNKSESFYPHYIKTYIERDVRDLLKIKDLMTFRTFMRLCASRTGSIFNISEIANETGISVNTVKSWLSTLQTSYIVFMLPPYFENIGKRLVKSPKLYFTDTGLVCYLLDIETPEQLARDKMRGALFENLIVSEALKHRYNQGKESNLFFYRDSHQNEVDLLLRKGEQFHAIEIKSAQTYNSSFEKGLKVLESVFGERVIRQTIVYTGDFENTTGHRKLLNYRNFLNQF
jgi:predicted AAA+ superfamily ATPase